MSYYNQNIGANRIVMDLGELPLYTNQCSNPTMARRLAGRLMKLYPPVVNGVYYPTDHEIFISPVYRRPIAERFFRHLCFANAGHDEGHLVLYARFLRVRFGCRIRELAEALHPMMFAPMRREMRFVGFCANCVHESQLSIQANRDDWFSPMVKDRIIRVEQIDQVVQLRRESRLVPQAHAAIVDDVADPIARTSRVEDPTTRGSQFPATAAMTLTQPTLATGFTRLRGLSESSEDDYLRHDYRSRLNHRMDSDDETEWN